MPIASSVPFGITSITVTSAGVSADIGFEFGGGPKAVVIQNRGGVAIRLFTDATARTTGTVYFEVAAGSESQPIWLDGKATLLHLLSSGADCAVAILSMR